MNLQLFQTFQIIKCSKLNFLNIIVPNISKIDMYTLLFNLECPKSYLVSILILIKMIGSILGI